MARFPRRCCAPAATSWRSAPRRPNVYPLRFPRVDIGPQDEILPLHDRRLFWSRTVPETHGAGSLLVAGFVLFIWWRRRTEVLYGLFGLAAAAVGASAP